MAPATSVKHSCRRLSISSSRELPFWKAQKVKSLLLFPLQEVTLAPVWTSLFLFH